MTLDMGFQIFDMESKPLEKPANVYLAEMLLFSKGDSLKLYELAMRVNETPTIEVDTTDLNLIEKAVRDNERYNNLVRGAILKEFAHQKARSAAKEEKKKNE